MATETLTTCEIRLNELRKQLEIFELKIVETQKLVELYESFLGEEE